MISDTLAEALWEMQRYLNDPAFSQTYSGTLRTEIERVMEAMESLRAKLDQPPADEPQ